MAHPQQVQPLLADHIPTLTCSGALCTLEHVSVIHLAPCSIHRTPRPSMPMLTPHPLHHPLCPQAVYAHTSHHPPRPPGHLCSRSHLTPRTIHRTPRAIYAHTHTSPLTPSTVPPGPSMPMLAPHPSPHPLCPLGHLCPHLHLTPHSIHCAPRAVYAHTHTTPLTPSTAPPRPSMPTLTPHPSLHPPRLHCALCHSCPPHLCSHPMPPQSTLAPLAPTPLSPSVPFAPAASVPTCTPSASRTNRCCHVATRHQG